MSTQANAEPQSRPRGANFWTTGMALFSMFFGAGNLIFPLIVGAQSGTETGSAVLGIGLSAVLFPLLGLVAMLLYRGDLRAFLSRLGPLPAFLLLFVLNVSQGPLAVLPRLVTLMHGSVGSFFPGFSLGLFSIFICALIFFLALRPNRLVQLLGAVLTPLLLATMACLIAVGIFKGSSVLPAQESGFSNFLAGLKGGYQTTDLIAALLFATIVIPHLLRGTETLPPKQQSALLRKNMIGSSLIAAALLMLTYIGLSILASRHAALLAPLPPEQMLHAIASTTLGPLGAWTAAIVVFLACLTTALSLTSIFSNYLHTELLRKKGSPAISLLITTAATAFMSNLGFSGLMQLIGPAMEILYPSLIVLCIVNIGYCLYSVKPIKVPVYAALGLGLVGFCL